MVTILVLADVKSQDNLEKKLRLVWDSNISSPECQANVLAIEILFLDSLEAPIKDSSITHIALGANCQTFKYFTVKSRDFLCPVHRPNCPSFPTQSPDIYIFIIYAAESTPNPRWHDDNSAISGD